MNLRLVLAGAVALTAAGGAAWMVDTALQTPPQAQAAPAPRPAAVSATVKVLVAARPIEAGVLLQDADVRWQAWPKDGLSDGFVVRQADAEPDVTGRVSPNAIAAGLPIVADALIRPGDRGFLAAVLPAGRRATTIPIDATTGVAGFVFPGDRVDLILTFSIDGDRGDSLASQTVLQDVRVIATDQKTVQKDGKAAVSKTATVEVTPAQAEKIALALQLGRLSLSLRAAAPVEDAAVEFTKGGRGYTVAGDVSPLFRPRAPRAGGTVKPRRQVTVMRGGEASEVKF